MLGRLPLLVLILPVILLSPSCSHHGDGCWRHGAAPSHRYSRVRHDIPKIRFVNPKPFYRPRAFYLGGTLKMVKYKRPPKTRYRRLKPHRWGNPYKSRPKGKQF